MIMREILTDHVASVAKADDEILESEVRIDLHDVPQNGLATDFNHGFGSDYALLTDP
jgi:hypothetical protein